LYFIKASNTISGGRSILGLAAGFIALRGNGKGIQIGPREYGKVRKDLQTILPMAEVPIGIRFD
jgi:hypothetical protein